MKTRLLMLFFLLPVLASGQIAIGDGIRLTGPGYDPDALSYFSRAGVTDATAKQRISDFFKGLKSLGAWDGITEAWLLRSSQNVGSGTVVQGIKGAYSGTFVGSPSWTADGIVFTANASQVISTFVPSFFPRTVILVRSASMVAGSSGVASMTGPSSTSTSGAIIVNSALVVSFRGSVGTSFNLSMPATGDSPRMFMGYVSDGSQRAYVNGSLVNSSTNAGTPTAGATLNIAGFSSALVGASGTSTASFAMLMEGATVDAAAIYTLYKNTVGAGLGLL